MGWCREIETGNEWKKNEKNIMDGAGFKTNPFDEYLFCFFSAIAEEGAIYCTKKETHYGLKLC